MLWRRRVALRTSAGVTYLHGDHLGSTSVASNASGALVARQTYYAYGAPRTSDGALPTDYTFTGQRLDADAGLMYYGARYNVRRLTQRGCQHIQGTLIILARRGKVATNLTEHEPPLACENSPTLFV